ncbi:MAG: nucleotidyltransferase domain-containing protein [Spirochaetales bacterium]|nr:nucleotidyltransferase domain-containing protein [Spirochaetales bacterium]
MDKRTGKLILKVRTGSHLYGLSVHSSDTDYLSVFIPHSESLLGLSPSEYRDNSTKPSWENRRNTRQDIDDTSFSLPRFLKLLLRNNPNIIEVLFATQDNIIVCEPQAREIIDNYKKFVSQRVKDTFTGYAYSQKKKLVVKRERFASLEKGLDYMEKELFPRFARIHVPDGVFTTTEEIITFVYKNKVYWGIEEKDASALNNLLTYYKGQKQNCESFHKGMDLGMIYGKIKEEYEKYGWRVRTTSFNKVGYDTKFAYHLIRLLFEGWQLLTDGRIQYPVTGPAKEQILKIRSEVVSYDELMEMYDMWYEKIMSVQTSLPEKPDREWANAYLIRTLKHAILHEEL